MLPLTTKARHISQEIQAWTLGSPEDFSALLPQGTCLEEGYGHTPLQILQITGPHTTGCGRNGYHIHTTTAEGYKGLQAFARLCPDGLLRLPNGHALCPTNEKGHPILPEWHACESTPLWEKEHGEVPYTPIYETSSSYFTEERRIFLKEELTSEQKDTIYGKREALATRAKRLLLSPEEEAKLPKLEEARIRQSQILCRYIRKIQALECTAQKEKDYPTVARLRSLLEENFSDLSLASSELCQMIWDARVGFEDILIPTNGKAQAVLSDQGTVFFKAPTGYQYAISWKAFKENEAQIVKEANILPKEKKAPKPKDTPAPTFQEEEEAPEAPCPIAYVLEVEPETFSALLSGACHSGIYGAVSETGYHSQLGSNTMDSRETLEKAAKNLKKPSPPKTKSLKEMLERFDTEVVKFIGKTNLTQFFLQENITEDNFYNVYHPIQAAYDEKRTLQAEQYIQEAKFELSKETRAEKLNKATKFLKYTHAPASNANAFKWRLTRRIYKFGKGIKLTAELNGKPIEIEPFCKPTPTWQESAENSTPSAVELRTIQGKALIGEEVIYFPTHEWDPHNPKSLIEAEDEEEEAPPKEAQPEAPVQLALF